MKFLDIFKTCKDPHFVNRVHQKIHQKFSHFEEEKKILVACIAGLMARVSYVDFEVTEDERKKIAESLVTWMKLEESDAQKICELAIEEMKDFHGLDVRIYCTPLIDMLSIEDRYQILIMLFGIAASDGQVENSEANEIQYIANALVLEKKYFLSAQATVKEYLLALKK